MTLVEKIKHDGNTIWTYKDTNGNVISFRDWDEPWDYSIVDERTSNCYKNKAMLESVVTAYHSKALKQHELGGYDKAIQTITVIHP